MKKTLLIGLLAFAGISANAQQFPNFAVQDINGVPRDVQSYLAEGKTVLLDISATWCAPCWAFHNSHTLEKIHQAYGPGGSDEVVVLFVEGDAWTPLNNIYGEGTSINYNPARPPQGDWTEDVSYPIINDDNLAEQLGLTGFPSLYRICPNGTYAQIPNSQFGNIQNIINSMNACGNTLEGVTNHAKVKSEGLRVCENNGSAAAIATFTNYGTNHITSATLNIKDGEGTIVATKEYSGNLAMFATATVTFDDANYATGDYTVELTNINSATPFSASAPVMTVSAATESTRNFLVKVYTDNYPSEISWAIKDSNGEVMVEGGPYQAGNDDEFGGGGPDANTTKIHQVLLPEDIACYSVELYDSYGDGWIYGSTDHAFEMVTPGGTVILRQDVGNFGNELPMPTAFRTNGTLGNQTFETSKFAVYPNPTSGILNFTTQEAVNVTVMDLTGKVVFTAKDINDGGSINLSSLQSGMYVAKISGATAERIEKIVIK